MLLRQTFYFFFFFNDTATTEIYTLSLHDALPIYRAINRQCKANWLETNDGIRHRLPGSSIFSRRPFQYPRSEEHTSELQSHLNLVCRLLLEKKKFFALRLLLFRLPSRLPTQSLL